MSHTLRSRVFCSVLLLFVCAVVSLAVFAQSTLTGGITGTVTDQEKAVVVGAKVTVRNLATNAQTTATTDNFGKFRVDLLQPGRYDVEVQAGKFSPAKAEAIVVEVGRFTALELVLHVGAQAESVEVRDEAPVVNTEQPDFSTNINQAAVSNLPVVARRWSFFALQTPGVEPDGTYYLLSFRGISGLLNNNTVDGGDNNNAFWSEERGRTRASYTVSEESIQEFQVNTSNYSAEYGRAAGAVVNSVTKSGTNTLHGEGFIFDRDNQLGAMNPFTVENVANSEGGYTAEPFQPEDRRLQFGGNVGGAIIKDKLFFFFNYDEQLRKFPGAAVPSSTTFLSAPTSADITTLMNDMKSKVPNITQAQALQYFQNGLNFLNAETGTVPRTGDEGVAFPKLDWIINQNNKLSASYNRMRWNSPWGIQTGANAADGIASWGNDYVKTDMLNVHLTTTVDPSIMNELRYSWGRDFQFETPQSPSAAEVSAGLVSPLTGYVPDIYTGSGGISIGTPDYLPRAAYPDETRNQIADTVSWNHGHHFFKFGFDFDRTNDVDNNLYEGLGYYDYSSRDAFIADLALLSLGEPAQNWTTFSQSFGPQAITYHTWDYAGFIQDDWKLARRFTLNLGLRYDYEQLPAVQYGNPNIPATMKMPSDGNNFGPRVGFAWDMFGNGKTVLRGGYGIYYGRINNGALESALFQTGAPGTQITYNISGPTAACAPSFPNLLASASSCSGATPSITYLSPNLQNPQIHEIDMVLEREIARNTMVSVSYLGSFGRELPNFINTNLAPSTQNETFVFQGGPFSGQQMTIPYYTQVLSNAPNCYNGLKYVACSGMYEMVSNINSSYNAMVLQFNRRMTRGLQFNMSYTWSHAIDDGQNSTTQIPTSDNVYDPYNQQLEKGDSAFDIRQRFISNIVWQPQYFQNSGRFTKGLLNGWSLAPAFVFNTGKPYTETISGNAYTCTATKCSAALSVSGDLNGTGSGGERLAYLLGRNSFRYPNFANVDMRLSRTFNLTERQHMEVMVDAFNLFNSLQVSSLNQTMYTTQAPATPAAGAPTTLVYQQGASNFGQDTGAATSIYGPRQIQFGLRYSF